LTFFLVGSFLHGRENRGMSAMPLRQREAPVMRQHLTRGQRHGFHRLG
jgi:hypothetical protein